MLSSYNDNNYTDLFMSSCNFTLELHSPDGSTQSFDLNQKLLVGTSADADIKFSDPILLDYHCAIKVKENVIAIHNLAGDGETKIDQYSLGKGKMYLLSPGDKIHLGEYFLLIVKEKEGAEEIPAVPVGDSTAPSIVMTEETEDDEEITAADFGPDETEDTDDDDANHTLAGLALKVDFATEGIEEEDQLDEEDEEYDDEDLKMLEAIQEGRQPEGEDERTSFFKKFFKFGKKKEELVTREKQLFQRIPYPCPRFVTRILALMTSVSICYALVFTVFPLFQIDEYLLEELSPLLIILGPYLTMINPVPLIYMVITFAVLEIVSAFLLGASIPYFLMGIKSNDREVARRLKGTIRAIIGLVTLPLIIFDLPALVGKPTIKEVITRTRLGVSTGVFIRLFSIFLIVIPLAGICLLSPFLLDMEHITGLEVHDMVKRKMNRSKNTRPVKGRVNKFQLAVETELSNDLEFLPYFSTTKMIKEISPALMMLSNKKKRQAYLGNKSVKVDFKALVKGVYAIDPFFPMNYPILTTWVTIPDEDDVQLELKLFESEFEKLFRNSFSLTPPKYAEFISQTGPFPSGYLILRKKLLKALGAQIPHTAVFSKSRLGRFTGLIPGQVGQYNNNFYISFKTIPPQLFEIKYSKDSKSLARLMERDFLQNSVVGEMNGLPAEVPYNTFDMLNVVNDRLHMEETDSEVFNGIISYYSTRFTAAKSENKSYTEKYLLKSLRSLIKALKTKYKGNKLEKVTPLLERLIELKKSLVQEKGTPLNEAKPKMPQEK